MNKASTILVIAGCLFHPLTQAAPDLDRALKNPNNWAHARGQYNNQGYSALSQINTNNVKDLKLAWTFSTGVNRGHEGAPLVIDGVMYVHTGFPNNIYALDLNDDQKILWSYFPKQEIISSECCQVIVGKDAPASYIHSTPNFSATCCNSVSRGLAYGAGNIYLQQNNGMLIALNAKTGQVVWQVQVNDPKIGATNTNAPMVARDKVLTGCSGSEFGVRCFMTAYNLKDGTLAWKAYSTGSDNEMLIGDDFNHANPQYSALSVYEDVNGGNKQGGSFKRIPTEQLVINQPDLGLRTWLKPQALENGWEHGGGEVTGYFAFDAKTNLVYYGTGNPGVWNPDIRPGDNKWASSVFARDVDTGMAKWAMQTTPHDEWDYDASNEVILFEKDRKTYAVQVNKNGFIYTWQADNGTLLVTKKAHPFLNWAKDVDLRSGVPEKLASANTHQDYNAKGICPSHHGIKSLAPAAYSPKTGMLYIPLTHECMTYEPIQSEYVAGQPWKGATTSTFPGPDGVMGGFAAYDPMNGKYLWYRKEKFAGWAGVLVTASDLIFYGNPDRTFKALDASSGKELWKFQVGAGVIGNAFTYSHRGKQYIGILSGGVGNDFAWNVIASWWNHPKDTRMTQPDWQIQRNTATGGGALNVFSL
ncbi:MAG TPA: PQQ-dependent dehydrogenase, methanol/ethanol family [Methylobacter sp.]|jgi:PQQ-dependent dehydrogenase (methanol/ethanol family)